MAVFVQHQVFQLGGKWNKKHKQTFTLGSLKANKRREEKGWKDLVWTALKRLRLSCSGHGGFKSSACFCCILHPYSYLANRTKTKNTNRRDLLDAYVLVFAINNRHQHFAALLTGENSYSLRWSEGFTTPEWKAEAETHTALSITMTEHTLAAQTASRGEK